MAAIQIDFSYHSIIFPSEKSKAYSYCDICDVVAMPNFVSHTIDSNYL